MTQPAHTHLCGLPRGWWEISLKYNPPKAAFEKAAKVTGRTYSYKNFRNKLRLRKRGGWQIRKWTSEEVDAYNKVKLDR